MIIEPPNITSADVRALFTTKASAGDIEGVLRNLGMSECKIYLPLQRHTNRVHILESDIKPMIADAVVTDRKGLLIGVQVADCVPILLYDRRNKVIGAVHAGWRGTAKQILKTTIRIMKDRFLSNAEDIFIAIGPGIRQCCYDVEDNVKLAIMEATGSGTYYRKAGTRYFIDLPSANRIQALSAGIPRQNIWQSEECTSCNPERFYSHRYSGGHPGRQGGFIGMW
jgi:hypothetical protein